VGINEEENVGVTDGEKDGINDIDDGITDGKMEELIDSDCASGTGVRNSLLGCNNNVILDAFFIGKKRGIPFRFDDSDCVYSFSGNNELISVIFFVGKRRLYLDCDSSSVGEGTCNTSTDGSLDSWDEGISDGW